MFKDSDAAMGGLVLDCCTCHRMLIYPIHRPQAQKDWNKHGRQCIKCILENKFPNSGLEGYIEEAIIYANFMENGSIIYGREKNGASSSRNCLWSIIWIMGCIANNLVKVKGLILTFIEILEERSLFPLVREYKIFRGLRWKRK